MPSLALLLRCLLLVTLCLDARPWAMHEAAPDAAPATAVADAVKAPAAANDCEGKQPGGKHDDCDCGKGVCGCACVLTIAALPSVAPSLLPHARIAEPLVWSAPHHAAGLRTPLFRPPIA